MTINPVNKVDCFIGNIDPNSFEDLVAKLPDDRQLVGDYIWDQCWKSKEWLRTVMAKWFGWQGGTIHQVIERVMEAKRERGADL